MQQASTAVMATATIAPGAGVAMTRGVVTPPPPPSELPEGDDGASSEPAPPELRKTPTCDFILGLVDRWRRWLWAIVITYYIVGFTGVWRPEPDAALYMTIGRNLVEGRGYTYMGTVDGLAYPGLPYLWAGVFKVFGTESLFVPHLLMFLLTGATLVLVYAYFRLQTSRPMAIMVTMNTAVANTLYLCAYQLRNDVPFLFGVMAFLTGYEAVQRRWRGEPHLPATASAGSAGAPVWGLNNRLAPWILLVAGLAIAVVMRPTMWALVGAIVLAGVWSVVRGTLRKRYLAAVLVVVVAAVVAFYALDPRKTKSGGGQYEQVAMNWIESPVRSLGRVLSPRTIETFGRSTMEAMFGHEIGFVVNSVVTVSFLAVGLYLMKRRPLWLFYLLGTIAIMLVMAGMDVPNEEGETGQLVPRHFIGALPLLMYLWWRVAIWVEKHTWPRVGMAVVLAMTSVSFGSNFLKDCETVSRQRVYGYRTSKGATETTSVEEIGRILRDRIDGRGTVVVPHKWARQFVFYSGCKVVEATPVLKYQPLERPVYVLDRGEQSVADFLKRNRIVLGEVLAAVPGRADWRGKQQNQWVLSAISGRRAASAPSTSVAQ